MHIISQLYDVHPGLGKNHYNLLYNQVLVQQLFRHLACHNKVHVKDHNYISWFHKYAYRIIAYLINQSYRRYYYMKRRR